MTKNLSRFGVSLVLLTSLAACGDTVGSRAVSGGLIGAGGGAAIGGLSGGNAGTGALIGGLGGAVLGGATATR